VTTNTTSTGFSASGVGAGTYYVRVRAQNGGGTSGASNESILVVASTACTEAPNAPSGLVTTVSASTVTLTWSAPAGACPPGSYVLQAGSSAGASDLANANVGNTTSYVAGGVGAGTYYVRVRAANAYGQSPGSNEVVVTVTAGGDTGSLTHWLGVTPGGMIVEQNPQFQCPAEYDLQLDLTVTGTTVTGTAITRLRQVVFTSCHDVLGEVAHWSVINGRIDAGAISFELGTSGSHRFSGTLTSTRMTGTFTITQSVPTLTVETGSFSLNRS